MRTADEIMTPNPKMIGSGETLEDVLTTFLEQGITSSPVINPLGEIMGILSEFSLVKAYMLHKAKLQKNDKVGHHLEQLEPVNYINRDSPLIDVLREMISSPTHRLLVKDSKGKIVGIISPKDIMRGMLGQANPNQNIRQKLLEAEAQLKSSLQKVKSLEKSLDVYHRAFHETPYMMHAVDTEGTILMANKREHDVLGYKDGELIGKTIFDIYSKQMHGEAARGLKKVIETGHHHLSYTSMLKKDGTTLRCDVATSSLQNENGEFISTISVLRPLDPEELLRSLNGIVNEGPLSRYGNVTGVADGPAKIPEKK